MTRNKISKASMLAAIFCGIFVLVLDRLTKLAVMNGFSLYETRPFLKGIVELTYIHNNGGAWGMLAGKTYILVPLTVLVMVACIFVMIKFGTSSHLLFWAVSLVISGGLGNMADRIFYDGNVVDFLHFEFFPSFPVFNVADIAIVVGAGLLILYFIVDAVKDSKNSAESGNE